MKVRVIFSMLVLLLVVFFTLQNTETVQISFLVWNFTLSRALMIFLVFAVGFLLGFFLGSIQGRPNKPRRSESSPETLSENKHE